MRTEQEIKSVKALGDEIGYGNLMCIASALWRNMLRRNNFPINGAFVPVLMYGVKELNKEDAEDSAKHYDDLISKHLK